MPQPRGPRADILMCPPDFFDVEYAINPWMDASEPANHAEAVAQWNGLVERLERVGATIHTMRAIDGLPDLVFTANAALIYGQQAVLSHFQHPQRRAEQTHNRRWLSDRGFDIVDLPAGGCFEGAGDALFCGDTLYAGYRMRSDAAGHQKIAEMFGVRVIPLELVNQRFYHLDTCFCPLSPDTAIYFPDAFDEYARKAIREYIPNLITVEAFEASQFACNAVVVGSSVVTNTGCPILHEALRAHGFKPHATPLGEFLKAGGSAKCLTLRLDGEDAATWKIDSPEQQL